LRVVCDFIGDGSHVGSQREGLVVEFEKEAGVVVAVMRYVERGNLDSFNLKWFLLFDMNGGAIEAIPYQPVVGDASVHSLVA